MKIIVLVFATICLSAAALADDTTTVTCHYDNYGDNNGFHRVKKTFILTFIVDSNKGVAYMVGNNGSAEVKMFSSGSGKGLTLIEVTGAGNIMTTTIDAKRVSVHSRNTVIDGDLVPSQYYGKCVYK